MSGQTATLQIALDRIPLGRAERITEQVSGSADWIEVGTSLIKQYGVAGLRRLVDAAGGTPVLADLKTADDARTELAMAYDAGARSVTVLGLASPRTLDLAVEVAAEYGRELMVDLMELDAAGRARVAAAVPHSTVLAAHVPKDAQPGGADPAALLGEWAAGRRLALAGGLGPEDIPRLAALGDVRLIVGSAVSAADDPAAAAARLRHAIEVPPPDRHPRRRPSTPSPDRQDHR
jgi:3-hexulose-6-phosphate synthase